MVVDGERRLRWLRYWMDVARGGSGRGGEGGERERERAIVEEGENPRLR